MPLIDKQIIRKVENQLRSYPQYYLDTAEQRETLLHGTPKPEGERTCNTYKISDPTMMRACALAELTGGWFDVITRALKQMPGEYSKLVKLWYFDNKSPLQVADRLHVSRSLAFAWRENAIMYIVLLATQKGLLTPIKEGSETA